MHMFIILSMEDSNESTCLPSMWLGFDVSLFAIFDAFFRQECSRILQMEMLPLEDSKYMSYYSADRLGCVVTTTELKSS